MLNELLEALKKGETVDLSVRKTEDGAKVAVAAKVDLNPDDHDEVALKLRAALSRPMVVSLEDGEDADASLADSLKTFNEQHRATRNDLSSYEAELEAERKAAKEAQAAKAAKKKTAKKTTTKAASSASSDASGQSEASGPSNQTLF